jgi:predicted lipid-binding transport protein (Tim44 family)
MKKLFSFLAVGCLTVTLALSGASAEAAKRFGGGKSAGKQSNNVTQRDAAPSAPGAPANAANAAKPAGAAGAAGAAAAAPKKPWGAMLGGLAAGLGLAWLASSLGLGEAFGNILMFALLALVVMMAVGWFMRRRAQGQGMQQQNNSPFAMAGAGNGYAGNTAPEQAPVQRNYSADKIGNDASARPWERNSTSFYGNPDVAKFPSAPSDSSGAPASGAGGSLIGSRVAGGSSNWSVPSDFDAPGFLANAKQAFVSMQAAWDKSDLSVMRGMMTDSMLSEIRQQLAEREQHTGAGNNHTEVVALDAKLLGIEDTGTEWLASVEFSGMIKEDPSQSPGPFREVWNMSKPKDGSAGWLVAGLQALN